MKFLYLIGIVIMLLLVGGVSASVNDYNSSLVVLMHLNGANGGKVFTDEIGHTVTYSGEPSTNTAVKVLGSASLYTNGTTDRVNVALSPQIGTGDFTVKLKFNASSITASHHYPFSMAKASDGSLPIALVYRTGTYKFCGYVGGVLIDTGASPTLNQWYDVVIMRQSGEVAFYVDGALAAANQTDTTDFNGIDILTLGTVAGGSPTASFHEGYVDEVAVWKGVAIPIAQLYPQTYEIGTALFTPSVTSGESPLTVTFTDRSTNAPTSWKWGRNNLTATTWEQFSTSQNPTQTFVNGNWSVNLTATNSGLSNISQSTWINVSTVTTPIASFTQNKTSGQPPLAVLFTDTSTNRPKVWNWSVNNTDWTSRTWYNYTTSTNLVQTFTTVGIYNVTLSVQNITESPSISTVQHNVQVNSTLAADFVGTPLSGFVPQDVAFVDFSTGADLNAWSWNFGDGVTSNLRNPTHTYVTSGSFTVSLQTTGADGVSTKSVPNYVVIGTGNIFVANQTSNYRYGMPVVFNNSYPAGQTMWNWSFGDTYWYNTTTAANMNVTHFYSVAKSYTVSMMAKDAVGTNTSTRTNYINLYSDQDTQLKSRMHMNGVAGAATFVDEAGNAWTATSVTTETAQQKFGSASALFNAGGDRLSTATSSMFDFGTGDFTMEQWVRPTSLASGDFIISRTASGATKADGWGVYYTGTGWVAWFGTTAVQTGEFTLPINTWTHLAIQRYNGVVYVYVDGVSVTAPLAAAGNYDTPRAVVYGKPTAGAGINSVRGYLDETGISNTSRWAIGTGSFSTPFAEYSGNISASFIQINPGSTLRFKTDPSVPSLAVISNLTGRQRTVQMQNINITNNVTTTVLFKPKHQFVSGVTANTTHFTNVAIISYSIDNDLGQVTLSATRPGGFSTTGLTDSRGSFADIKMVYYNYTQPSGEGDADVQYFANGFFTNGTTGVVYPAHNFIATNVSFADWVTFSGFTANNTAPVTGESVVNFIVENNFTANRFLWNWGDGTSLLSYNQSETHIYPISAGLTPKTVTLTAYLWQNNSVRNTTTKVGYIVPVYNTTYVSADFVATPTSGLPGVFVSFADTTVWGNLTAEKSYKWAFGDGVNSSTVGSSSHVYPYLGEFTVTLTVNNTANLTLGSSSITKMNYIIVSSNQNQQNTWWTPHGVQVNLFDTQGTKLPNVRINANFNESAMPQAWVTQMYGIQAGPAGDLFNKTLIMSGTTGGDGTVTFTMLGSLKYDLYLTSATYGLSNFHTDIFPSDPIVNLHIPTSQSSSVPTSKNNTYTALNQTRVYFTEPNISYVSMCIDYKDDTGLTTSVTDKWYFTNNNTMFHSETFAPGAALVTKCYDMLNLRGTATWWGYNATRSE